MSEEPDLNAQMEEKSRLKKAKISRLREINGKMSQLQQELLSALPAQERSGPNPRKIQESMDKLEFYIATSAYTPAQEKDLIRKVDALKKELKAATKDNEGWEKARKVRAELRDMRDERRAIRKELDALSAELDSLYQKIIAQGTQEVHKRREGEARREQGRTMAHKRERIRKEKELYRKEMEPYMKEVDPFVSLEDIAEVKKKK
ncbi:hypothetical protein COU37_05495 [Candidatus Micrarchaeota archaeon CG10_big_fil_rev_8_21_14_0_10_45_29]|nr:MAG: hypothetical protein COU37_05495 [Candidatus Micrarchaeota archaeon CG10_big_fil_rev_8_21_14_0_10_45_29]